MFGLNSPKTPSQIKEDEDTDEALNNAFARFKELADKKHEIFDEDLQALVSESNAKTACERFKLVSLSAHSQTGEIPTSEIVLNMDGKEHIAKSEGSGPVDAAFKAIEKVVQSNVSLQLYNVNAITEGTDSQGEVTVRLEKGGRIVNGSGADTDIVIASAKAYICALNMLMDDKTRQHPQAEGV